LVDTGRREEKEMVMWSMFNKTKGKEMSSEEERTLDLMVKVVIGVLVVTWVFAAIGVAAFLSYFWG
jgi:hypothetical protein